MKFFVSFFTFLFTTLYVFGQSGDLNMKIVAHVPAPEGGSGIWHYVDRNGIEYAAFGSNTALVIYSLEDPANPIERYRAKGVTTIWREVFSYGDYVYGATDNASDGLIIINMKEAPNKITHKFWTANITTGGQTANITTCHTLFVDEKGILSLNGCRPWQGVLFFDLKPDPENPVFLGSETKRYCHDNFVRRDTMYSSDILNGLLSIWDVKNPANPVELTTITTPFAFTHNSWPSDDSKYVFTTDEKENAYVASYDISDFGNIKLLDQWRPKDTEGTGVIPHNTRYLNGYLITAYYTDGVKIIDAHKPDNLIEVGSVDTYLGTQRGFHGCWGVSPYLPSGTIVASDIEGGMFVIKPEYVRACYLEGKVTDSLTKENIANVSVVLKTPRINGEATDLKGQYKTGYADSGTFDVDFTHPDYLPKTVSAKLEHGVVTLLNVELIPRATVQQKIVVKEKGSLKLIEGAQVVLFNKNRTIQSTTGADGQSTVSIPQDNIQYEVVAGKWGYLHKGEFYNSLSPTPEIVLLLEKGYQDDYLFDLGWTVQTNASAGGWVRAEPLGTVRQNAPVQTEYDVQGDYGDQCYVTGNSSTDPSADDVDGGETILTSPAMDLSTYRLPLLNVSYWFANSGGSGNPNDSMQFLLLKDAEKYHIATFAKDDPKWNRFEKFRITDVVKDASNVRFQVVIGDYNPGHLVEGALDAFLITEGMPVFSSNEKQSVPAHIYPTAFSNQTTLYLDQPAEGKVQVEISDLSGMVIARYAISAQETSSVIGKELAKGIYLARVTTSGNQSAFFKLIKL